MAKLREALTGRHDNYLQRVRRRAVLIAGGTALAMALYCCAGDEISGVAKSGYHLLDDRDNCFPTKVPEGLGVDAAAFEAGEQLGIDMGDTQVRKALSQAALAAQADYAEHNGHVPAPGTEVETCVQHNWLAYAHNHGWNAQVTFPD